MALQSKAKVTPEQIELARRLWFQTGSLNRLELIDDFEAMKLAAGDLERLHEASIRVAQARGLSSGRMAEAASPLAVGIASLQDARLVASRIATEARGRIRSARTLDQVEPVMGAGGRSRAALLVRLVTEEDPSIPLAAPWWLKLDDVLHLSPNPSANRQQRRTFWKALLRRVGGAMRSSTGDHAVEIDLIPQSNG